ncbi:conserved hypothetical protein, secreted [Candidatus Magnetomorum sp. HK-1]|nr:conserved hypothetical protein, secreted [Candidatus Magnetomorum sp. HK-1]
MLPKLIKIIIISMISLSYIPVLMADTFEPNNSYETATLIYLHHYDSPYTQTIQQHDFTDKEDEDWVQFYVVKGNRYVIKAKPVESSKCDPAIEIYGPDGQQPIDNGFSDKESNGTVENIEWTASQDGLHFARFYQCIEDCSPEFGELNAYHIIFSKLGAGAAFGYISGQVFPCNEQLDFSDTNIISWAKEKIFGRSLILPGCFYFMTIESGSYELKAFSSGFFPFLESIQVEEFQTVTLNIHLDPKINDKKGDINKNDKLDIGDVIQSMKYLSR